MWRQSSQSSPIGVALTASVIPPFSSRGLCQPGSAVRSLILGLAFISTVSGCVGFRGFGLRYGGDPLAGASRPRWADDPQVEEVVDHLNRNVEKLQAWRADSIKIRANNMPLSGTLAVERGRHLRLVVNSIAGNEVDLGSNDDLFWIWAKRMPPPEYIYCRHEQADQVRQAMGIPFEPDWLMQALGVAPISTDNTKLEIEPRLKQARLVQHVTSAHGRPLRKVVLVDLRRGVILEHSIYDFNGRMIATARLDDHQLDRATGVVLPRRVKLDWPQNEMSLVMNLGHVEVNPRSIPSQIWDMPPMQGYQMVDLGTMIRPETRIADSELESPVEIQPPEFEEDDSGRVRISTVSDSEHEEEMRAAAPGRNQTPRAKRPIPREWWND